MSKNIKGQALNVNLNITEAGTFNADIFNAYNDFTLNGVSIVNRIVDNESDIAILQAEMIDVEADIVDLENNKQDNLVIQQSITASSTAVASADAIIAYVGSVTPAITATAPLVYSGSNISANFDDAPTNGSINFLNSNRIYDALALKQNNLVIQQNIIASSTAVASADAIIAYVTASVPNITASAPLDYYLGNISATFDSTPTFGSNKFISSSNIALALAGKQNLLIIQQTLGPGTTQTVASANAIINALTAKQDNITSATAIDCGDLNINGNTNATGYIYCNADITSTSSIASPIVLQGTTNLLDEINTKQDIIDATTNITTNNLDVTGTLGVTGQATLNALTVSNAIVSTGSFVTTSGNIITQTGYIEATSGDITAVTGDITATNGNIRATSGNIVVDAGDITASIGDIVATTGTIQGVTISGDIFSNLSAGGGITLTQDTPTAGITQISADALSTSTEYAFQVTSSQGGDQIINVGTVLNFNSVVTETPSSTATEGFNTSSKRYYIPSSGYYQFGFKAFVQATSDVEFRLGMYQNGVLIGQGGRRGAMTEDFTVVLNCVKGDYIDLRGHVGSSTVFMGATHSWFWGHKIQSVNNTIEVTTDLSLANLTATGNITGNIVGNLNAGQGIDFITTNNITTIKADNTFLSLVLSNNYPSSGAFTSGNGYACPYDSILASQGGGFTFNQTTGVITSSYSGYVSITATVNIRDISYSDRVNFRIRLEKNGAWSAGLPQSYSYARHGSYASYATSTITESVLLLNATDTIRIWCNVAKAGNTFFSSDFNGLQLFNGGTITLRTLP